MANIAVFDLDLMGSELFNDSESYMRELSESEFALTSNYGGGPTIVVVAALGLLGVGALSFAAGYVASPYLDF